MPASVSPVRAHGDPGASRGLSLGELASKHDVDFVPEREDELKARFKLKLLGELVEDPTQAIPF